MTNKPKGSTFSLDDISKKTPPQILETRLSSEGLAEVVLQLGPRKIIVSEADYFSEYRLGSAVNLLLENPLEDVYAQGILINIYPGLVACSSGDVPQPGEFVKMGQPETRLWIDTARKLNPNVDWFSFLDEIEKNVNGQPPTEEQAVEAEQEEIKKKG